MAHSLKEGVENHPFPFLNEEIFVSFINGREISSGGRQ